MTTPLRKLPWSVPVRRDNVPDGGLHFDLVADEATRTAIAALAGLRALPHLAASFDVARRGGGLAVIGEVAASVVQSCVVTLEPVEDDVREPVDLVFVPEPTAPRHAGRNDDDDDDIAPIDPEAADEPETLVGGVVDLGAIATEFLLLGLDPYPRKPGAVFEAPNGDDAGTGPFAALAALKKDPTKP